MLKELKKNKMSVVATGILFGVMGVLIIPMIAVIVKISNALSQKHPRIYKYTVFDSFIIAFFLIVRQSDVRCCERTADSHRLLLDYPRNQQ